MRSQQCLSIFFITLIYIIPNQTHSVSYSTLQTLTSLSSSILLRISTLRSSRGDITGSGRAKFIANKLRFRSVVSLGWDYIRNYACRDTLGPFEVIGVVKDLNELVKVLGSSNYRDAVTVANSLFQRLLKVFHRSGPLRQLVETLQKEVVEGDLLRDCLELGSNDLNSLIQIMKDVALLYSSNSDRRDL